MRRVPQLKRSRADGHGGTERERALPPRQVGTPAGSKMTMEHFFVVIRSRGAAWDGSRSMESQEDWEAHASFMNSLEKEGFVVLGGPLEDTSDVLLVVRARNYDQILSRLSADPWTLKGLLRVSRITPWTLRLGSLR